MKTTASSIKVSGAKLFDLTIQHKGIIVPVNIYLAIPAQGEPFNLCVCFEDSPIETRLEIDKLNGEWVDLYEGASELARIIGAEIEKRIKPSVLN